MPQLPFFASSKPQEELLGWQVDYGEPLGPMRIEGNVARRSWSKYDVSLDCSSFTATFDKK